MCVCKCLSCEVEAGHVLQVLSSSSDGGRGMCITDQGVKVGAGGAITVLSDPQDEWDEMELKASALLSCAKAVATPRAASSCHGAACRVGCDGEASY